MKEVTIIRRSSHYLSLEFEQDRDLRPGLAWMNATIASPLHPGFDLQRTVWDAYPLPRGGTLVIAWLFPQDVAAEEWRKRA